MNLIFGCGSNGHAFLEKLILKLIISQIITLTYGTNMLVKLKLLILMKY